MLSHRKRRYNCSRRCSPGTPACRRSSTRLARSRCGRRWWRVVGGIGGVTLFFLLVIIAGRMCSCWRLVLDFGMVHRMHMFEYRLHQFETFRVYIVYTLHPDHDTHLGRCIRHLSTLPIFPLFSRPRMTCTTDLLDTGLCRSDGSHPSSRYRCNSSLRCLVEYHRLCEFAPGGSP